MSIARALFRVAGERGLEEVSLRHVAAAAGVSTGAVQHYFRSRDEMMLFALSVIRENVRGRVAVALAALGPDPSPRALVRAALLEMLPLDEPRTADARVGLMFNAYAAVRPEVAAELRTEVAQSRAFMASLVGDQAAVGLLAMAEGMAAFLLGGHYDAATAVRAVDAQLDLLSF